MTATAHALVAGAIAARFTDPVTVAVLGITSHYIMDSIPHWDFGTNWRKRPKYQTGALAIAETATGFILAFAIFGGNVPAALLFFSVVMSLLPDWLETPWYILYAHRNKHEPDPRAGIAERLFYALYKIPNVFHSKAQLPLGILTQIATVAFFVTILS